MSRIDPSTLGRSRDELAFLPAALEVIETPPSPIGRAIAVAIVTTLAAAVAWASFGSVDIVAVAPGRIMPTGRIKVVQPLEAGVVRAIHVRDGQRVREGEALINLDPTVSTAELGRLSGELMAARLDVARLRAALAPDAPLAAFRLPEAPPALVEMQRGLLESQVAEQQAKLAAVDRQQAQKVAEGRRSWP